MTDREPVATESVNIADEQQQKLKELFPEVFSEGCIDFDKLCTTLGDLVDGHPDRYNFSWACKREALRMLQLPTRAICTPTDLFICRDVALTDTIAANIALNAD